MATTNDPDDGGRGRTTSVTGPGGAGPDGVTAGGPAAGGAAGPAAGGMAGGDGLAGGPSAGHPAGVKGTRTSHTWVALAAGLFFLIVVLVFILQNLKAVRAHFFWGTWTIPLAVDLLLAAVLGALIMFTVGSLRMVQLRRAARRVEDAGGRRSRRH